MTVTIDGTNGVTTPDVEVSSGGSASAPAITVSGDTNTGIFFPAADTIAFAEGGVEAMRIDSSGKMLVGTTTSPSAGSVGQYSKVVSSGNTSGATGAGIVALTKGAAAASIVSGDDIGFLTFTDNAGNDFAYIRCQADANAGSNDYPGRLIFATAADGSASVTERARITSGGDLQVATTTASPAGNNVAGIELQSPGSIQCSRMGGTPLQINRGTDDGDLVSLRQAGTQEGTISVSGTTVSYNGGHLSRWAQMLTKPDLLKGTVMSNLDEMNEYVDAEGNPVENEQLNKVKVSDVEGDANVAGVFVNWTYDEAHQVDEINMAMTGDMIIRIAQGVTVARGDLLMSAGDGTAMPQGDDIVRSKTIAKVTSTHVTCTYDDGSYCVPCVLMAC